MMGFFNEIAEILADDIQKNVDAHFDKKYGRNDPIIDVQSNGDWHVHYPKGIPESLRKILDENRMGDAPDFNLDEYTEGDLGKYDYGDPKLNENYKDWQIQLRFHCVCDYSDDGGCGDVLFLVKGDVYYNTNMIYHDKFKATEHAKGWIDKCGMG